MSSFPLVNGLPYWPNPLTGPLNILGNFSATGTGSFGSNLSVTGNIIPTASLHASNGSAANPSIAFLNSQNTGFYRYGAGAIGTAIGGTAAFQLFRFASRSYFQNPTGAASIAFSDAGFTALNPDGGNVLVGTTTDSANGKLQLATHTTSAGGIGFGTDVSLYRVSGATTSFKFQAGAKQLYFFADGSNCGVFDTADASSGYSGLYFNNTLKEAYIDTNATRALKIDNSQNVTLTARLLISGATSVSGNQRFNISNLYDGSLIGSFYAAPATNQKFYNSGWDVGTYGSGYSGFTINGARGVIGSSSDAHTRVVAASGSQVIFGSLSSADGWTTTNPTFSSFGYIDSSGLTVAGTIALGQYTTAGAPAYAKGKLYFDVTLNKLRVGGATGWETITSV